MIALQYEQVESTCPESVHLRLAFRTRNAAMVRPSNAHLLAPCMLLMSFCMRGPPASCNILGALRRIQRLFACFTSNTYIRRLFRNSPLSIDSPPDSSMSSYQDVRAFLPIRSQ